MGQLCFVLAAEHGVDFVHDDLFDCFSSVAEVTAGIKISRIFGKVQVLCFVR